MAPDPLKQAALRVIRIGLSGDNDLVLEKPGISRHHAELTLYTDFLGILKDLDSTHGTEVNGRRIDQKLITPDSKIVLGTVVPLDIKPLFDSLKPKPKGPPPISKSDSEPGKSVSYGQEFKRVEFHFEKYLQAKKSIQTDKTKTWIRIALMFVPAVGMQLAALADAYAFNPVEKIHVLDEAFAKDYICPNPACNHFLGFTPYRDLLFQKQCRFCKCKWVDD